ncbi:hypothetical protein EMIHUDRAFT_458221 [Emiliania huxleyi CCMP1516]|uniref:Uncharacterized protein n=2 Tax=Emiliania huxleyi TaxID=2903 RepID=A0A0D3JEY0_EMIH1|nr:hypothetical protein EMIHUDRAFT_458221 [Emiliania huxleyi CCMP1516]EOD22065.1 hypothetical protein EMIHUDRAFT_458221 [Emiliania huxleyi CCMP1516]|eukprot:XP_005774494.1 hypothetical protein EMIHUDRAFT_458221 [Emiliania huxleyi CCMP1516]
MRAKVDHSGLHIVPPARRFWNSFAPQSRFANDGSEPIIGSAHDGNAYSDYYYGISSWDGGSGGTTATGYYYLQALDGAGEKIAAHAGVCATAGFAAAAFLALVGLRRASRGRSAGTRHICAPTPTNLV